MHVNNFFVCGPKFTGFFSSNVGGVVDQLLFRFSICGSISEIFAIKVESCQKSRKILDGFFALPNFGRFVLSQILGGRPSKSYTHVMTPVSRHVVWKMFCEDTPTSPEVIVANTLNFQPNFKISLLKIFWGNPSHFGCGLSRLGQSLARV